MELSERRPSLRRLDYHYIAMQAGFWAMFAAIVAYQTALLLERGFSNSEAGLMTAVRCLAGIVFQPLLGGFADRHPRIPLKYIVGLSLLISVAAGAWYWLSPGMGLWETTLAKHDRARASYYNYYTENRWGEAKNYDLCLNAALGREACAQLIVQAAKAMQQSVT